MKISKSTIVRTILVLMVIVNFVLERMGIDIIPVSESAILMFVETAIEVAIIISGFWYNNSFSQKALKAQKYLEELRSGEGE